MPNKKEVLPEISILIPTYNRSKFLKLCLMNLKNQLYPHELLTVIIDDDGSDEKFIKDNEIEDVKNFLHPIKLKYLYYDKKRSIGAKRNNLVKQADTKLIMFFDDDDLYHKTAITHTYETMIKNKKSCAGSDKMMFCMTEKDFSIHMIDCGNTVKLIHEATLMMTKKFFRASCGFENSSQGEGKNLFFGMEHMCAISDISKVMLCIQHSGNTVPKLQFYNDNNKLNIELSEEMKNLLKEILEI